MPRTLQASLAIAGKGPLLAALLAVLALPAALLPAGCSGDDPADGRLAVAVSIPPLAWLVESVGGPGLTIETVAGPGDSPATFDPTPRAMGRLSAARIYFAVGVPLENALLPQLRRSFPDLEIVDLAAELDRLVLPGTSGEPAAPAAEEAHAHGHAAGHAHEAGELDPHVWLSPRRVRIMAHKVAEALVRRDPDRADAYRANLAGVLAELERLDGELSALLAPLAGRELLAFHPAYGYLAADYGLRQVAIEEGGQEPSPRRLAGLIERHGEHPPGAVFVQPQFSDATARTLARQLGVPVVPLDPLARDYPGNLRRLAAAVREALGGEVGRE